jgi:hypothetical protein
MEMKATITVAMDNAAFGDEPNWELARILRELAHRIHDNTPTAINGTELRDVNGNYVGQIKYTGKGLN